MSTHSVRFIIDGGGGIMPVFVCHDTEAPCHFVCPQGCEEFSISIVSGEGTQIVNAIDESGHALERRRDVCTFVEWMEAVDDPFEHYDGPMTGNLVQNGPVLVAWDKDTPRWSLPRSFCVEGHSWRLAESGYVRTWSIRDPDDDPITDETDLVHAYNDRFDLEGGDGNYWLECRMCVTRQPYVGEIEWAG